MNMEDFQEKMNRVHRMYLCRMLKVKELPEDLLRRYAEVKMLVDRIDGHLTPGDLAMIIVSVGDNPEIATELLEESDDKVIEEAVEQLVEQPTPEEGKAVLWSPGMPVNVFHEDQLKQGKIVGIVEPAKGSKKARQLTVEFAGEEPITFDEDEVEAR